jgi:antitoxin (DNA-binding transcriptional repressor) of toxin-antitoxin stability system
MVTTIRNLRTSTKEILSAVSRGETVWITNRGKTCAKITAVKEKINLKSHPAFGMLKDDPETADVRAYIRKIRKGRYAL